MSKPEEAQVGNNHQRSSVSPKKSKKRRQGGHDGSDDLTSIMEEGGSGIVGTGSVPSKTVEYGTDDAAEDRQ